MSHIGARNEMSQGTNRNSGSKVARESNASLGARYSDNDTFQSQERQLEGTPLQSYHLRKKRRSTTVSSSIHTNKRQRTAADEDDVSAPPPAKGKKPCGLGEIGQAFVKMVMTSRNPEIDLKEYSKAMKVPIRRLYDIINILDGAGVVGRIPNNDSKPSRILYRWIAPGVFSQPPAEENDCIRIIKEEEANLDSWMEGLRMQNQEYHVTSNDLQNVFGQNATILAIVNTCMSHVTESRGQSSRYSLSLRVPPPRYDDDEREILPEAFLYGGFDSPMQLVTFPSVFYPSNQENIPDSVASTDEDTVRDYSPLKKLLAAIPTGSEGENSCISPNNVSLGKHDSPVHKETKTSRHPFETLLEASTLHGSNNAQTCAL